jgi:hypothetical protein
MRYLKNSQKHYSPNIYAPSPSGRGLGRGGQLKAIAYFPLFLSFSLREKGRSFYMAINNPHDFTDEPFNDKGTALTHKNDPLR